MTLHVNETSKEFCEWKHVNYLGGETTGRKVAFDSLVAENTAFLASLLTEERRLTTR